MSFSIRSVTPAFVARRSRVRILMGQWSELIATLGERSGGVRESGAFLLADIQGKRPSVRRVVYFDDLDPKSLNGGVSLDSTAFGKLWELCSRERLRVIADVHTHPGGFITQSDIDKANPLVSIAGHVAIVVPHLAQHAIRPEECGVTVYLGSHCWTSEDGHRTSRVLYVGRWA